MKQNITLPPAIKCFILSMVVLLSTATSFAQTNRPEINANIGNFASGAKIPAEEIKGEKGLGLYQKDATAPVLKIVRYTIVMDGGKDNVVSVECKGDAFSGEATKKMEQYLTHGKIISFENIVARDDKGTERKIPSIFYIIN